MSEPDIILYAEDDENDAFLIERAFKKAGISNRLVVVSDGNAAVEYLAGEGKYAARDTYPLPGLILLDLNIPGKSGLEVLKWIRVHPLVSMLLVVVLTSSNQESDIHRAYIQGTNGYLVKPRTPDEMLVMARAIKDYWLTLNRAPGRQLPPGLRAMPALNKSGLG
jgi:CheY-like chemotaxis protein